MSDQDDRGRRPQWSIDSRWILGGFLVVIAFFLVTEHRAHLYGFLPFLLLLACPLMHLFHGHGSHHHDERPRRDEAAQDSKEARP